MTTLSLVQPRYAAEYILSEGEGLVSRDNATLASGAGKLAAGTVLGKITASKKFVQVAPAASDGSQHAAGILFAPADATSADVAVVVTARMSEVNGAILYYPAGADASAIAAINADLAALNIIVR